MSITLASGQEIQRTVLVPNHTNRSWKLAEDCRENIQDRLGLPAVIQPSVPGGPAANAEHFDKILEPGDVVGGIFGDGTARDILLGLRKTPFISLRGGNARDIGRATHRVRHASPSWLIRHSRQVEAYALHLHIQRPDGQAHQDHAISYIGAGETAMQTALLATDAYRNALPVIRDARLGLGAIASGDWFEIVDHSGEEQRLSDLTIAKGSRMAKLGRFPIHHWDEAYRITPVGAGLPAKVVAAAGLLTAHASGVTRTEPYSFLAITHTSMHVDGEPPIPVPALSNVTVGLHEQKYNLLTSR